MSWVLAFLGFSALIVLHEFGHFAAAKAVGMRVERFALFFPPLIFKVRRGETEYGIGAVPLGGYVRITGMNPNEEVPEELKARSYSGQPVWKRVFVIGAGPAMNLFIALGIWFMLFWVNGEYSATSTVSQITPKSAAAAQLKTGDRLVSVDGQRGGFTVLSTQIKTHTCANGATTQGCVATTPAKVVVVRDGALLTLAISPRYDTAAKKMLLGFTPGTKSTPIGPVTAAGDSVSSAWRVSKVSVEAIGKLFYSSEARKQVSGVVGSYETTRSAINSDFTTTMNILALISLSLAVINMFPFLPLDGGHIFWALAEKVRGKQIPYRVMERASVVGFMLVIFLFAIGLTNDIGRLQGAGFGLK